MRSASSASTGRAVSRISAARCVPTARGSIQLMPSSWPVPALWIELTNLADAPARHRSAASANAKPMPAAAPFTAAITGCGNWRIRSGICAMRVIECFAT